MTVRVWHTCTWMIHMHHIQHMHKIGISVPACLQDRFELEVRITARLRVLLGPATFSTCQSAPSPPKCVVRANSKGGGRHLHEHCMCERTYLPLPSPPAPPSPDRRAADLLWPHDFYACFNMRDYYEHAKWGFTLSECATCKQDVGIVCSYLARYCGQDVLGFSMYWRRTRQYKLWHRLLFKKPGPRKRPSMWNMRNMMIWNMQNVFVCIYM